MSFRVILDQVSEAVDVTYMGGELFFTRGLKFQAKLTFYMLNQLNTPLFDIYSTVCGYYCKRKRVHLFVL
ncbi:hypothetical protein GQ55_6G183400 [Panicum hallii var. hallii]|uniref:Uncharacterized protein n=1 Tax=Panicum hallii var. hallii TaxID=1504633 RepID=A0A2T7D746_9POAL|nr:hypothetical protein GQ55_6G183400 [Panicum hallii var. hallii]